MRTQFEKFIEKNYKGLTFLSIPNKEYTPGVILSNNDQIFAHLSSIFPHKQKWKTKIVEANLANQTISGERSLDAGVSFLGLISTRGNGESNYTVSFEFNEVSELIFDHDNGGAYENEVRTMISNLKDADKKSWKQILHKQVTMSVIIVKSMTVEFKKNGTSVVTADIPQLTNDLNISGSYNWVSEGKMIINNDNNMPFGVLGFEVKRFG